MLRNLEFVLSSPIWTPSIDRIEQSEMERFRIFASRHSGKNLTSYKELYDWSIEDLGGFWESVSIFCGLKWAQTPRGSLEMGEGRMLGHRWFPGSALNFAENLMPPRDQKIYMSGFLEGRDEAEHWTGELIWGAVSKVARWLSSVGVKKGDRVVGILANTPESVIAMLAATSLGAVWASCSPDFGVDGIVDRFGQIEPKVVFFTPEYEYNSSIFKCLDIIGQCRTMLDSVVQWVPISFLERHKAYDGFDFMWSQILEGSETALDFVPVSFEDPVYILFSSGTTGKPKCIIHGVGGTLLQHFKELRLHSNLKDGKSLLFFTTCGWMMWNWMASALGVSSRIVLYEGSVARPSLYRLWDLIESEGVSVFGSSPKFFSTCIKGQIDLHDREFDSLESILSTGSPLVQEHYRWIYKDVKRDLQLSSISGGTDIVSCFMLGNPVLPVYEGEIQGPGLGMAVEAWVGEEDPAVGEKGELVCTRPFVSMPVGFWNDDDGAKYRHAYFSFYDRAEVWRHGDYIEMTENGGVIVYGRSDSTLNPGGIRIGTAEIYRRVDDHSSVLDSIVVGVPHGADVEIWLFLKLAPDIELSLAFQKEIKSRIRKELTPRHVPQRIFQVGEIPYTKSGKKLELAVLKALLGEPIDNLTAMVNPQALDEFKKYQGEVVKG